MATATKAVADILEHHGVKGMKWGRTTKSAPADGEVRVTQKGKKLKTEGGKNVAAHPDAVNAAKAKQQASASGIHSLSNKQLQELSTRMNLEQNVARLTKQEQHNSSNFITKLLNQSGQQEAQKASNALVAKSVETLMKR
ncbi:MAG TPA: hypothetical protein PKD12_08235 [Nitrospira sp.]|nr:hypothetical protein [Nitrospira sp.]